MNIPFVKYNNLGFITSSVLIVIAILSLIFKGLNFGLEFTGGISATIKYDQKADLSEIRDKIGRIDNADFIVSNYGSDDTVLIKLQNLDFEPKPGEEELTKEQITQKTFDKLFEQLELVYLQGETLSESKIDPQIGSELRDAGGIAILVAMLVILVYIIFRFQIKFGYGAIAALFHDVFIILGIFSVFNLAFDLSVLAAILAIVGYSLNDSIVVSDRIRENFLDPNKKGSSEVLINDSLNQVFARTIITSFTTLLVLMALLFAGGEALKNFSLALAIGVVIGSYSSIFIVVKVLLATNLTKKDMEKPKNEPEESYSLDW